MIDEAGYKTDNFKLFVPTMLKLFKKSMAGFGRELPVITASKSMTAIWKHLRQ